MSCQQNVPGRHGVRHTSPRCTCATRISRRCSMTARAAVLCCCIYPLPSIRNGCQQYPKGVPGGKRLSARVTEFFVVLSISHNRASAKRSKGIGIDGRGCQSFRLNKVNSQRRDWPHHPTERVPSRKNAPRATTTRTTIPLRRSGMRAENIATAPDEPATASLGDPEPLLDAVPTGVLAGRRRAGEDPAGEQRGCNARALPGSNCSDQPLGQLIEAPSGDNAPLR